MTFQTKPSRAVLLASISILPVLALAAPAMAQSVVDELIVTATRRAGAVQDVPINIAAVGGEQIEQMGLSDLAEIAAWTPGVHLIDQGGRTADRIVVRGLNLDPLNQTDVMGNNAGGTVATYLGEIPIYLDLKLNDMERIEFLLGPQGTLYGAGTLGGAIRYIPVKPRLEDTYFQMRGEAYSYSQAEGFSTDVGVTFNLPLGDTLAVRGSVDMLNDTGFIDYNYVVAEPGVTNPNIIDPDDPDYDLVRHEDANGEETVSGRLALRWVPNDVLDATLTYYVQNQQSEGRTITHRRGIIPTGDYESAMRVLEPNERNNQLLALEVIADLGFAELTSATGASRYTEEGQRDQTNLLITLEYSYEAFPAFTAFTREEEEDKTFTQELRLVSKGEGPLSWIVGGFYNHLEIEGYSAEFTPGFSQYTLDAWGVPGVLRPDALEYYAPGTADLTEKAVFGEVSYQITEAWQVTVGGRWYSYELETADAVDFPLLYTTIDPDGRDPDEIVIDWVYDSQSDDGFLYKFNTSYEFSEDVLAFFTISQGYRVGGGNGVTPCPDPIGNFQSVCGLPDELAYSPDTTTNYELGVKSQFYDKRLTVNASIYHIDWQDPQLLSATVNGSGTITKNGKGAQSRGFELFVNGQITEEFGVRVSYAHNKAELTAPAPGLVAYIRDPDDGPPGPGESPFSTLLEAGQSGDRLPGSPEQQLSVLFSYDATLSNGMRMYANYGVTAVSDVVTRTGARGGSLTLPSYGVHNATVGLSTDAWSVTFYADNLFDVFGETGVTGTSRHNQTATDENGDPVYLRAFFTNPIAPRKIGVRFSKEF